MAVNPRVLYGYLSGAGTMTADSTDAAYAAQNAVYLDRATGWKSGGTSSQRLMLSAGSSITPTGLGICAGNYSVWGTTKLQHSTDGATWTDFYTLASLPSTDSTQDYYADFVQAGLTPVAKPWWALRWTAASAAPELSVFYLGTLATLLDAPDLPYDEGPLYGINSQESEGRIVNAELVARRRMEFEPSFDALSTVKDQAVTLLDSENGSYRPYFWVPMDESGSSSAGRAYLVRAMVERLRYRRQYGYYSFSLPMREEV